MAWFLLLVSSVLEAVWATALGRSEGFTLLVPTLVFVVGDALSTAALGVASTRIPMQVAYPIWVGLGAGFTALSAVMTGEEDASPLRVALLVGIIVCVIGLKLSSSESTETAPSPVGTDEPRTDVDID